MNNINKYILTGVLCSSGIALFGCAGPTTPLGAVWSVLPVHATDAEASWAESSSTGQGSPLIQVTPTRQVLHGPSAIRLTIKDSVGDLEHYQITVRYNGVDVTKSFLRHSKYTKNSAQQSLRLENSGIRLGVARDHQIEFSYRNQFGGVARTVYEAPTCAAFKASPVVGTGDFDPPKYFVFTIDGAAAQEGFNPAFLAGLIAQESSFNPKRVSWAKALGLTQVTSVAEEEIIEHFSEWPRYPGIESMSLPRLKFLIATGKINATNEWRLNPINSILGGAKFARLLAEKWAEKWNGTNTLRQIASSFEDPETVYAQLILASYHSGFSRVAHSIEVYGKNWIKAPGLREARKYIRRVFSYCSYFTDQEVENARTSSGA